MNRDDKLRRYFDLYNKDSYSRTPEDAAEIRRLNDELFGSEQSNDSGEHKPATRDNRTMNEYTHLPPQNGPEGGRILVKNPNRTRSGSSRKVNDGESFSQVKDAENWSRLFGYYSECLIRENRQQYVIKNWQDNIFQLDLERTQAHDFIQGKTQLEYLASSGNRETTIAKFLGVGRKQRSIDQQLCFGYPMFSVDEQSIAPLIIATLALKIDADKIQLEVEDYEISYAALESLNLQEEEIAVILDACAKIDPEPNQSILDALELELMQQISGLIGFPIKRESYDQDNLAELIPGQLYDIAGLFRVKPNIATANLIEELRFLTDPAHWDNTPNALKELLSITPEREYLKAKAFQEDNEIYVTVVNDQQRRAISSTSSERVTVVTGPPGTGKSQLVLNVIAQALLHNQSVLFASRNNKAVDVVMDRLQNDIAFPGCVRTGNKANRQKAAIKMRTALSQAVQSSPPLKPEDCYQRYQVTKNNIVEEEANLSNVRDLNGLISSYEREQMDISQLLSPEVMASITEEIRDIHEDEIYHLLEMFSNFRLQALNLREIESQIVNSIKEAIIDNEIHSSLIEAIRNFETQWGPFGGRFLNPGRFGTLHDVQKYLSTWKIAIPAFEIREQLISFRRERQKYYKNYEACLEHISDDKRSDIEGFAENCQIEELEEYLKLTAILRDRANILVAGKLPIWERFLSWLQLRNPIKLLKDEFVKFIESMSLDPDVWIADNTADISQLDQATYQLENLLNASKNFCQIQIIGVQINELDDRLRDQLANLPKPLEEDISRLEIDLGVTASLYLPINRLSDELKDLMISQDQLVDRINKKILLNDENLEVIRIISGSPIGSRPEHQKIQTPISQIKLIEFANYWRNLILLWKTTAGLQVLRSRLEDLPQESELIDRVKHLQGEMLGIGAEIIRKKWLNNISKMSTKAIQDVYDYISAVEQLCGPYNRDSYRKLKDAETRNFPSALRIFPIWATTNLAAKTNLPIVPELFDLVVIDEASQCDIPSAFPLLYRAKHILIIGDPNQLRHVATLYQNSDIDAATKFSISTEAFLYNTHSLFDLAQRTVGSSPGTLLLNEHYRSDHRIIEFSNQEFYDNRLVVRTDLKRRGIPIRFLNEACGVYWLHTKGITTRPPNGSAYNSAELEKIADLVPRIRESLRNYGMSGTSLGIVTPYREQEKRLYEYIPDDQNTTIGTAHKFQGDECDIIIFSPVLSSGISDGSLHWLEQTVNLLNVSVTRPRCTLLIVGDWDFCQNLSTDSKYQRLAQYVNNHQSVFQEIDDLPLLNSEPLTLIGKITDPTNREYNRITIRKFLSSCNDYIWWMDGYFNDHIFDLILDVVQQPDFNVQEIRLLTAIEQIEPPDKRSPSIKMEKTLSIQKELDHYGIRFLFGYLAKKELPHDRFLYSHNQAINMPPFGGAYGDHKMLSEYTRTSTKRDFFEKFWNDAVKLEQLG